MLITHLTLEHVIILVRWAWRILQLPWSVLKLVNWLFFLLFLSLQG